MLKKTAYNTRTAETESPQECIIHLRSFVLIDWTAASGTAKPRIGDIRSTYGQVGTQTTVHRHRYISSCDCIDYYFFISISRYLWKSSRASWWLIKKRFVISRELLWYELCICFLYDNVFLLYRKKFQRKLFFCVILAF